METIALFLAGGFLTSALVIAGLSDVWTRTIPNRLILVMAGVFAVFAPATQLGVKLFFLHLGAGAIALVIGFGCFAAGWIGGGDGKLMGATALWLGPLALPNYLLYSALVGGLLSLAILMVRTLPLPAILYGSAWTARLQSRDASVPYGVALAAGGLLAMGGAPWSSPF